MCVKVGQLLQLWVEAVILHRPCSSSRNPLSDLRCVFTSPWRLWNHKQNERSSSASDYFSLSESTMMQTCVSVWDGEMCVCVYRKKDQRVLQFIICRTKAKERRVFDVTDWVIRCVSDSSFTLQVTERHWVESLLLRLRHPDLWTGPFFRPAGV